MFNLKNEVQNINITMSKNNFVNECTFEFYSIDIYHYLSQHINTGQDVLTIDIQGDIYKFLVEEIDIVNSDAPSFSVWGRSKGAILADTIYTSPSNYSYTTMRSAHSLLQELCFGHSIVLNFIDFYIPANTINKTNVLPIDVIKDIVEAGALTMYSMPDGSLVFENYYQFSIFDIQNQNNVIAYFDYRDDIFDININYDNGDNYNAILINGYQSETTSSSITIELDDVRNNGRTEFYPNDIVFINVFFTGEITQWDELINNGNINYLGEIILDKEEEIEITSGEINLNYPIYYIENIVYNGDNFSMPDYFENDTKLIFNFDYSKVSIATVKYKTKAHLYSATRDNIGKLLFFLYEKEE